jgi:hypothetical protein
MHYPYLEALPAHCYSASQWGPYNPIYDIPALDKHFLALWLLYVPRLNCYSLSKLVRKIVSVINIISDISTPLLLTGVKIITLKSCRMPETFKLKILLIFTYKHK